MTDMSNMLTTADPADTLDRIAQFIFQSRHLVEAAETTFADNFRDRKLDECDRELVHRIMVLFDVAKQAIGGAADHTDGAYKTLLPAAKREWLTSVGKHVDIARRRDWVFAVQAWRDAEAVKVPADAEDAEFDKVSDAAARAFQEMVETSVPDMRAFHEKVTLIQQNDAWGLTGAVPALFTDIERFVRAEIAAQKLEG